jgi:hypothetical protein
MHPGQLDDPRNGRPHDPPLRRALASVLLVGLLVTAWSRADAVPSFARETGLPCAACHNNFPQLTPLGRQFKMLGYQFDNNLLPRYPPLAAMAVGSFTHTDTGQPDGAAPHFGANDNFALDAVSVFYGGRIFSRLAGFIQATYDGIAEQFAIDNTDLRLANSFTVAEKPVILGLTLNNNPTVQDPWNTTPAWGFPYLSSGLAPIPAASTVIDGGLAQQVYGLAGYTLLADLVYLEAGAYRKLDTGVKQALGVNDSEADLVDGFAPYWRVALQHSFEGGHYLSLGTYGLLAHTFPGGDDSAGTDRRTDIGVDLVYQYIVPQHNVTLLATWINEAQRWKASQTLGDVAHASDTLNTVRVTAMYMYDLTYAIYGSYFMSSGSTDTGFYAPADRTGSRTGKPDSEGFAVELDWLPLNKNGGPSFWPWFNPKFSLQYVLYTKFNGADRDYDGFGHRASDNNTLFVSAWVAF